MTETTTESPSTSTTRDESSPSDGPSVNHIRYLAILQLKKPGEVYAGTAKGRHRKTESAPARRRRRHKAAVTARSNTVARQKAANGGTVPVGVAARIAGLRMVKG